MSDGIHLPRSAVTSELWRNPNYGRLLWYLLASADDNGEITTDMAAIARDLDLSRQTVRTLMKKIESNHILTKSATTRVTKLKLDIQDVKPKRQPRRQPNRQPNGNQIKTAAPDYISPPFVADEFREIWHKYMDYRKEIRKPYKSLTTEKTAYEKMLKLAKGDPEIAKDIIERAILGQWQGLYETKNSNGNRNSYSTNRVNPPRTDEERIADYQDLADAVSRRIKARENQ